MAVKEDFSWSMFYRHRKEIRKLYPSVYGLTIKKKLFDVVIEELKGTGRETKVLDVGASTRSLGKRVEVRFPDLKYKTMDIDTANPHDYYSLADINEKFNLIILAEVIEHLAFQEGTELFKSLSGLLATGGKIIVSTPNLHHPNRFWDSDHRTPYRYDEISAALVSTGFDVEKIYRIYNDQFLKRFIRIYIMARLHRYLDVDFAKSIVVVARKR